MKEFDLRLSRKLKKIAQRVESFLQKEMGEPLGFAMVVFPYAGQASGFQAGEKAEFQYISNAPRIEMHRALKALVAKWDAGHVDIPPHEKQ